jgi:hypothetical protein
VAKGKGELNTYWLEMKSKSKGCRSSRSSDSNTVSSCPQVEVNYRPSSGFKTLAIKHRKSIKLAAEKTKRLIDWNTDVLCRLLRQIMVSRGNNNSTSTTKLDSEEFDPDGASIDNSTKINLMK